MHAEIARHQTLAAYKSRNLETLRRKARERIRAFTSEERDRVNAAKRAWRRNNPRKVYAQRRRVRLSGRGGFRTREAYLAYHRAYNKRHPKRRQAV